MSTEVLRPLSPAVESAVAANTLAEIAAYADPTKQLVALDSMEPVADAHAYAFRLLEFSRSEHSSASSYVRAFALQKGINALPADERQDTIAAWFDANVATAYAAWERTQDLPGSSKNLRPLEIASRRLCAEEGLDPVEYQRHALPTLALIAAETHLQNVKSRPTLRMGRVGPLTTKNMITSVLSGKPLDEIDIRFALVTDMIPPLGDVRQSYATDMIRRVLPEAEALEYATVFNCLEQSAEAFQDLFPKPLGEQAMDAAQELIGLAVFAVNSHTHRGGITRTSVALRGGRKIDIAFDGDEPLRLLQSLDQALTKLRHTVTDPDVRTVSTVVSNEFSLHRFINLRTKKPSTVKLYVRPEGEAGRFDPELEYGRRRKGVDASISYTVQLSDSEQIALGKTGLRRDTISVRLDRESDSSDPHGSKGKVSLDIGSILGHPDAFGTRIAYLLASGDQTLADLNVTEGYLNHSPLQEAYGEADAFRDIAVKTQAPVIALQASTEELEAWFAMPSADDSTRRRGSLATTSLVS